MKKPIRNIDGAASPRLMQNISLVIIAVALAGCDARVSPSPPDKVVEKNTTIVNPPGKEEKKVENNTTIINPPAAPKIEEKKTTTTIKVAQ